MLTNRNREAARRGHVNEMLANLTLDYRRRRAQQPNANIDERGALPLRVVGTETYCEENGKEHNTERFELMTEKTPVLRRGQSFYLGVRFDRQYIPGSDILSLVFDIGPTPNVTKGTRAILTLGVETDYVRKSGEWAMILNQQSAEFLTLQVIAPVTCPVGIWHCNIVTSLDGVRFEHKFPEDFYVLFNPWNKDDGVFMANDAERNEYVLNDTGKVWMGSYRQPKGRRWVFGQYDDVVLPTVMYLLELSGVPHSDRGNPVRLSRAISAVINSDDEDGLVEGRWDGDYKDGVNPHSWTGSLAIMERYLGSGGVPVKYGQCWVFSALVVTVCRALGIPCRSVTNYVSAHDTNCTLTVDKYYSKEGEEIEGGADGETYDSCWNFHVWNDVWMSRPDLPHGYGGWQIIDATPQEESDAMFRCGPASIEAVRRGKVGFLYDTPFVFAEVNADVYHFQQDETSEWGFKRLHMNQYHVGRKIVTKAVDQDDDGGDSDMWDVTHFYKSVEGSKEERLAVFNAVRGVDKAQLMYGIPGEEKEDVQFDLIDIDEVKFGEPFSVTVNLQNNSSEVRTIEAVLSASSVYYTGVSLHTLKKASGSFTVHPGEKETMRITVTPGDYLNKFADHSLVKIYSIANVLETKQTWSEEDDFVLAKPHLAVHIVGGLRVGESCSATFSFTNPLLQKLTDCTISIEGPGLQLPKTIKIRDIEPKETLNFTESFSPRRIGASKIVGTFNSRELTAVYGSATVVIN